MPNMNMEGFYMLVMTAKVDKKKIAIVLAAAVVLIGITVAVKLPARLTSADKVITGRPMSRRQVENMIADSCEIPSQRLDEQIQKRL
jgi:hypothetical protein